MDRLFLQVVHMSITASVVILVVILLRSLLKKAPKIFTYLLWGVVFFRLLFPVTIPSDFSLFRLFNITQLSFLMQDGQSEVRETNTEAGEEFLPIEAIDGQSKDNFVWAGKADVQSGEQLTPVERQAGEQMRSVEGLKIWVLLPALWLSGVGILLFYGIFRLILLKHRIRVKVCLRDNIYLVDHIESPFVLGVLFPKIYLPSDLKQTEYNYVLVHELHHIKRGDHLTRLLAYLALCLHWFNPLVWVAFLLSERDMEMSCDEAVVQKLGREIRAEYSEALLRLAVGHRTGPGIPLAFGEGETRGRIKRVMQYKKPKPVILLFSILICITAGGCLLTDSKDRLADRENAEKMELISINEQINQQAEPTIKTDTELMIESAPESISEPESAPKPISDPISTPVTPPDLRLQDSLSSQMNFFKVSPGSYSWSYLIEGRLETREGSGYFPTRAVKGKEWIKLTDYQGIDFTPYLAGFEVMPDRITVWEYDLLELGDREPVCLSETVLEEVYFLYLIPGRIYELKAEWDKENLEANGYCGEAYYAFATSDLTQTVQPSEAKADGESQIYLEAHVKEVLVDRPGSVLISSDTDSFPDAFILDIPKKVYDIDTIVGGQAFSITMQITENRWENKLPICRAVQMTPMQVQLSKSTEQQTQTALPKVGEVFEKKVNTLEGVKLHMEKYTSSGGTMEISNFSQKELQYGDWFDVQIQTEGKWYSLAYVVENIAFNSIAYLLPQEKTKEKVVDWEFMYGVLPTGTYRIVTEVIDYHAPGDFERYYIAAEFHIAG
ncbi:MAG: hypothetical protein IKM28_11080 [Lachnospiraceae bacterium]|nr:hypothetical protein [Lachnospiraceae bacterium]